ncbi:unnamed protein product [Acanthoscelides obtectus]|uniref:Uncharacterized protein n=1 Tax=Acanthoscelides obtectus TaxID=200917 RepID=A0A9P0KQM6_ACAOB|nr:unnamed protein product [Acanthoscelides obtectus]CAK1667601.1 UPF0193 protein EVG1 [Acanthoscelides obtectus]
MACSSDIINPAGILHPRKVTYSPETHQFLKLLMDETKMSTMQRNKMNYYLRNGEPLPSLSRSRSGRNPHIPDVTIRPGSPRRRTRETIIRSGVYERESFRPTYPVVDREKEKEKLQNKMAFNKDITVNPVKVMTKIVESKMDKDEQNRFDQIMEEIKEREKWLKEMEFLGEGNKYRHIIAQQIQEKVREISRLKLDDQ